MLPSARFFLCALCREQVVLCRGCDRGQIYCSKTCSQQRRTERQREAKARYANSRAGRHNNAQRQARHRARLRDQKTPIPQIVTDQGSALGHPPDNLVRDRSGSINKPRKHQTTDIHCHFCGQCCDPLLRSDFLSPVQRHRRYGRTQHDPNP